MNAAGVCSLQVEVRCEPLNNGQMHTAEANDVSERAQLTRTGPQPVLQLTLLLTLRRLTLNWEFGSMMTQRHESCDFPGIALFYDL